MIFAVSANGEEKSKLAQRRKSISA